MATVTQVAAPVVGTNRTVGVSNATNSEKFVCFNYTSALVTQAVFIAPNACVITGIAGVTRVAGSGGACTISFYKCSDGIAVGSGTLLHSANFDIAGTADINQYLTLSTNMADLQMVAGDRIGYVLTGTATSAVGSITITIERNV